MKNLLTFLILSSGICNAQSSFYAGLNSSVNMTTLLNKEDKNAPEGMLNKKNGIQAGCGLQIGYSIKNRIRISIEPNYLQYKINYTGKSDTANIRSFDANVKFKYYQVPLIFSYNYPVTDRISLFGSVGFSYNYMSKYEEEMNSRQAVIGQPNYIINSYVFISGKHGTTEAMELNNKWDIEFSNPKYVNKSYSLILRAGSEYSLTDKLGLSIQLNFQRGMTDIEKKGSMTEKSTDKNNSVYTVTYNCWDETNYMRYYYRYPDKYNQREATYAMALGLGIGINYYFNGGLLSSIHKQ